VLRGYNNIRGTPMARKIKPRINKTRAENRKYRSRLGMGANIGKVVNSMAKTSGIMIEHQLGCFLDFYLFFKFLWGFSSGFLGVSGYG
jgi:hypothetical protein